MKAPSNKVAAVLILVVIFITATISYNSYQNKVGDDRENFQEKNLQIGVGIETEKTSTDTDGDGLNDWEETLWGTSNTNPDTDGDGTEDGAEVALGRNPNKPGPDDLAINAADFREEPIVLDANIDPNTITARTSVDLAKQMLNAQYNGGEIDVEGVVANAQDEIQIYEKYKIGNILSITNPSKDDIREYGNSFAEIYIEEILKMNNSPDKSVDAFVAGYKNIALRMSTVRVPSEISGIHLDFINNIDQVASMMIVIRDSNEDPVKGFLILPKYKEANTQVNNLSQQIKSYLDNSGIIFNSDEPGFKLFGGELIDEEEIEEETEE